MIRVLNDLQYEMIGRALHEYCMDRVITKLSYNNSNVDDIDVVSAEQFYTVSRKIVEYFDYYNKCSNGER